MFAEVSLNRKTHFNGKSSSPASQTRSDSHRNVLPSEYYEAPREVRFKYAAQYLILAGLLAVMAFDTYEELKVKTF